MFLPRDAAARHGVTPLQIACGFGSPRVAQQLINAGAQLLPIRWSKIVEKPEVVQVNRLLLETHSLLILVGIITSGAPQLRR
jgi:ankyrin repeat protein